MILLDEIDKLGRTIAAIRRRRCSRCSIPSRTRAFNDHYLEVDYDLSQVLFITTANYLPQVPEPLRDRMEIIRLSGYLDQEKFAIARQFLVPKQLRLNGLDPADVELGHRRHSGDRARLHARSRRARARATDRPRRAQARARRAESRDRRGAQQTRSSAAREDEDASSRSADLHGLLGVAPYDPAALSLEHKVGVATGLAYTSVGGEVLEIEVSAIGGRGKLQLTGTLGDVMKESASAALSYARARAGALGIDRDFHRDARPARAHSRPAPRPRTDRRRASRSRRRSSARSPAFPCAATSR